MQGQYDGPVEPGQTYVIPPGRRIPSNLGSTGNTDEYAMRGTYAGNNYIPLNTSGNAQNMAANILASEFANWESVFKPVELNLLGQSSLNNPQVLTQAVGQAGNAANQTFDTLAGVERRQLAARGIAPNAQQQQVSDRIRSLSRAAGVAGAENRARANVATQDELIALGSAPNPNIVQSSTNAKYTQGG